MKDKDDTMSMTVRQTAAAAAVDYDAGKLSERISLISVEAVR